MKHLLIAVMIAILIGTIQAVQRNGNHNSAYRGPRTCTFVRATLFWRRNLFHRENVDVTGYIEQFRASGLREFRNDVHAYGWDRATGSKKSLRMEYRCCGG